MVQVLVLWLARWGHVLSAALWVGGYAALVLGVLPLMRRGHTPAPPLRWVLRWRRWRSG